MLCFPKARVEPHWLVLWEWNSNRLRVLELSNRNTIDCKTEKEEIKENLLGILHRKNVLRPRITSKRSLLTLTKYKLMRLCIASKLVILMCKGWNDLLT